MVDAEREDALMSVKVHTTFQPDVEVSVSRREAESLLRQGLLVENEVPGAAKSSTEKAEEKN